jgi:hypothetical protein
VLYINFPPKKDWSLVGKKDFLLGPHRFHDFFFHGVGIVYFSRNAMSGIAAH